MCLLRSGTAVDAHGGPSPTRMIEKRRGANDEPNRFLSERCYRRCFIASGRRPPEIQLLRFSSSHGNQHQGAEREDHRVRLGYSVELKSQILGKLTDAVGAIVRKDITRWRS